jgi:membrane protein
LTRLNQGTFALIRNVLRQTGKGIVQDDVANWAAAIAYYALLSAIPLMLAMVAIGGFFVDPNWVVNKLVGFAGDLLPRGQERLRKTVQEVIEGRETASLLSIVAFLWTGSRVFGVLTRALNVVYNVKEPYSFGKRLLIELTMLLTSGVLFLLAVSSGLLIEMFWEGMAWLSWVVSAFLLVLAFFLLYRFVPRGQQEWKSALTGAVSVTVLFLIVRLLFGWYIQAFANYNLVYGSLAIAVIFLVWAWVVSFLILVGGEIASNVQNVLAE